LNNEGEKGSPLLRPLELEKQSDVSPLIKVREANSGNVKGDLIPPLARKINFSRIAKRKLQKT